MGQGGCGTVTIYVDVLIALNLYVTWFLLLAAERLAGSTCPGWRRGLAALAGGVASLAILLPELPFPVLFGGKLLLAAGITWIAGGFGGWRRFCKRMGFFFGANFLFAGCMIALWLLAAPPRLTIRNGMVYYHIPALTLGVSTILAYGAVRLLAFFRDRRVPGELVYRAEIRLCGRRTVCNAFLDTGNRLRDLGGLPVVLCQREVLEGMLPAGVLDALGSPEKAAALDEGWRSRLRLLPSQSVGGSRLLCGLRIDGFRPEGREAVPCVVVPVERLSDGEYQAVTGPELAPEMGAGAPGWGSRPLWERNGHGRG